MHGFPGLKAPLVAKHHEPVVPSGTDKAVKPNLVAAKTAAAATAMAGLVPPAFGYDEVLPLPLLLCALAELVRIQRCACNYRACTCETLNFWSTPKVG